MLIYNFIATSGLDSYSAWKVIKILEALGQATGCAILCTIHQPSSEIFNSFHNVMMLCRGTVMYNGTVEQLPRVFANLNYPIPQLSNPADYIVLLAQTIETDEALPRFNVDELKHDAAKQEIVNSIEDRSLESSGPVSFSVIIFL